MKLIGPAHPDYQAHDNEAARRAALQAEVADYAALIERDAAYQRQLCFPRPQCRHGRFSGRPLDKK
jgi:hypothetical protein